MNMSEHSNDHDILITLVSEVRQTRLEIKEVKEDIKELKDNVASRVETLEKDKLDRLEFEESHKDHETRIRLNEQKIYWASGALVIIQLIIGLVFSGKIQL